jgi:CBS domain-containing protein
MKIRNVMTPDVELTNPMETIEQAAKRMAEIDAGSLPVGEDDRMVGMLTDRDIVVRCLARGGDPKSATVGEIMSDDIKYCFDDEEIDHVTQNMGGLQIRRLPVVNRDKRLVGIVSLGDIARTHKPAKTGKALGDISQPSA